MTRYIVRHPDGTTSTRTSTRDYTFAIEWTTTGAEEAAEADRLAAEWEADLARLAGTDYEAHAKAKVAEHRAEAAKIRARGDYRRYGVASYARTRELAAKAARNQPNTRVVPVEIA